MRLYIPLNPEISVQAFYMSYKKIEKFKFSDKVKKAFWIDKKDLKEVDACYYGEYKIWGSTYRILSDVF